MGVIPGQQGLSLCPTDLLGSPDRAQSQRVSTPRQPAASGQTGVLGEFRRKDVGGRGDGQKARPGAMGTGNLIYKTNGWARRC